ncbi:hypothetical protein HDU81_008562 [Chytriomyces hyalinus]|nr:hypothetical protein HDU81_008562 [Chytriomyces hyalinus]
MYEYHQFRHESKKWFSRVYLLFINSILFALAIFVMIAGWAVIKLANDNTNNLLTENVVGTAKGTGIAMMVVGSIIIVTSLVGSIGGCTRENKMLKPYIAMMGLLFIAVLAGGIYFLVRLTGDSKKWKDLGLNDWNAFTDYQKDMYQTSYGCCGFNDEHAGNYGGSPLFDIPSRPTNGCATNTSTYTSSYGCSEIGNAWYRVWLIISGSVFAGLLLVLLTGIGAADQAKKRAVDVGYQVTGSYHPMDTIPQAPPKY